VTAGIALILSMDAGAAGLPRMERNNRTSTFAGIHAIIRD
jgi:hypothetical protein